MIDSLKLSNAECCELSEKWRLRGEVLKNLPAWRLHTVADATLSSGNQCDTGIVENECTSDSTSVGNTFGLEHLIRSSSQDDKVSFRDSIQKRGTDFRSEVLYV